MLPFGASAFGGDAGTVPRNSESPSGTSWAALLAALLSQASQPIVANHVFTLRPQTRADPTVGRTVRVTTVKTSQGHPTRHHENEDSELARSLRKVGSIRGNQFGRPR